ncbi:MAG: arsenite efflux transporter metallochaperone ArsD [Candidatus Baltobacteraceae bacterium]
MKTIQIFDPALCCSTGVCGVDVDQALVTFSADVDWAKQNGILIERFNLSQQPMAFAQNTAVKDVLEHSGEDSLPITLVDDEVVLVGRYATRDELTKWVDMAPEASLFTDRIAELIGIGAAVAANCNSCFTSHYTEARKLGVSDADITRAIDLAKKIKDGPNGAMLDLVQRHLGKSATATASAQGEAKEAEGCCAASPSEVTNSKCC